MNTEALGSSVLVSIKYETTVLCRAKIYVLVEINALLYYASSPNIRDFLVSWSIPQAVGDNS